jgi:hypothetical protein
MPFDKECRAAIVPKRDFWRKTRFFFGKTTAYNAYLFNKYALLMNNWKNKAKNHHWLRNPIQ